MTDRLGISVGTINYTLNGRLANNINILGNKRDLRLEERAATYKYKLYC